MASSDSLFESGEYYVPPRSCDDSGVFVVDPEAQARRRAKKKAMETLQPFLSIPPRRLARLARIREEIARGTYETPERWEAALDGLMADVFAASPPPRRRRQG